MHVRLHYDKPRNALRKLDIELTVLNHHARTLIVIIPNLRNTIVAKKLQEHTDQKANTSAEWLRYRQSAISTLRTKAHLSWPERALLALSWSVLGFTELALHLFIHRRTLYSHDLALGGRLLLLCYSLSVLTIFLIFTATAIKLVVASGRHVFPDSLVASWIGRVSITLLVWLVLVFYGASWGLYWQTGSFIGSEVFIFMAPHPLQVFHWVDLDVALIILGLAGTAAIAITAWLPRLAAHQKEHTSTNAIFALALDDRSFSRRGFFGQLIR